MGSGVCAIKPDYPAAKLDIKLILERVDAATLAAVGKLKLRPPFEVIVVPDRQPRTKPKALNYALAFARGDYVCVYDAEDLPEPLQLREALRAMAAEPDRIGCVQSRLMIDNLAAGWLTRQFALEYLTLFDGILPVLARWRVPIPLGGTSNHFPLRVLRQAGGWDAWNVTEDADLGMRLARLGYRCTMIASATFEEAPHQLGSWIRQRSRWLKGWMQTYLVHIRRPRRQWQQLGPRGWFVFQAQLGGVILSALLYPFCLAFLALRGILGQSLLPDGELADRVLIGIALFNLMAGYGVAFVHTLVAALGRRRWGLLPDLILLPAYWLLISFAAYRALVQLARDPFRWEKTEHGQSRREHARRIGRSKAS